MWMTLFAAWAADDVPARLIAAAMASNEPWAELTELCDDIGPRLSGSRNLDRAVRWARQKMKEDGLQVELQDVEVQHWVRGAESARLLAPVDEPLQVLGLGMTVPTPPGGITAPVVVVSTFEALEALGDKVKGHIVVFDAPFTGYGETVAFRVAGPDRAAAQGAVAVLVRSVTDTSLALPHTGTLSYKGEVPKIPAAAITPEAAARFRRWTSRNRTVSVRLELNNETRTPAPSANVVGQVTGRDKPDEVVLLGCHLDSWDVGTGAQDDGAACVAVMEAVSLINALSEKPRRTVRGVLFTNEENGVAGGKAYALANAGLKHVAAIESDTGMGGTLGLDVDALTEGATVDLAGVQALLTPLKALGVSQVQAGYSGTDIRPVMKAQGGLALGVAHDMSKYWAIHHTEADTLDKIDPHNLKVEVATLAVLAWQLANAERIP